MNWLTNFVRPKLRALVGRDIPENLWHKCPQCEQMLFHQDLQDTLHVCRHCGHHMRISATSRLKILMDEGMYSRVPLPGNIQDPLKFKDLKKYSDRLKDARQKTQENDSVVVGMGTIGGQKAIVVAFDFSFMGGSMGVAVGEALHAGAQMAIARRCALIVVPASGGARMQEGILSLMQMARTTVAVRLVKEAKLPYIVVMTDPTAGGVTASFAMLGDVAIAEPGAMICFAGRRVIEQTIRQKLPDDFQTAEYLHSHGMLDMVVHRSQLNEKIGKVLNILMDKPKSGSFA
jgi:acetyl-CoA carboxylase carboxyl transferase subunit beta